jgi:hypothetical protein
MSMRCFLIYRSLRSKNNARARDDKSYFQFKFYSEKVLVYENQEYNRTDLDVGLNADQMVGSYYITYCKVIILCLAAQFDPSLTKWDNFSKRHHRDKLYKYINEIDYDSEYKINHNK